MSISFQKKKDGGLQVVYFRAGYPHCSTGMHRFIEKTVSHTPLFSEAPWLFPVGQKSVQGSSDVSLPPARIKQSGMKGTPLMQSIDPFGKQLAQRDTSMRMKKKQRSFSDTGIHNEDHFTTLFLSRGNHAARWRRTSALPLFLK